MLCVTVVVLIFNSCGRQNTQNTQSTNALTYDSGVVINGVKWATRNVDAPGTFARNPHDAGGFYQWNRSRAWSATNPRAGVAVSGWNNSYPTGTGWKKENDPCPPGWRVPTRAELTNLLNQPNTWISNWNDTGVSGRLFGTAPNQIFLPSAGWRLPSSGTLDINSVNTGAGKYWSSGTDNAYFGWYAGALFFLFIDGVAVSNESRKFGANVRCVADQTKITLQMNDIEIHELGGINFFFDFLGKTVEQARQSLQASGIRFEEYEFEGRFFSLNFEFKDLGASLHFYDFHKGRVQNVINISVSTYSETINDAFVRELRVMAGRREVEVHDGLGRKWTVLINRQKFDVTQIVNFSEIEDEKWIPNFAFWIQKSGVN